MRFNRPSWAIADKVLTALFDFIFHGYMDYEIMSIPCFGNALYFEREFSRVAFMKVVIAGAGIGGLTAGLCCLQRGMTVQILEKAPALSEIGAGIQISPNAMRVFQKLGLDEVVVAKGFLPEKLETRMGRSGRRLFAIDAQSWDAPYVHIHRADLIDILRVAFARQSGGNLKTGSAVTGFEQRDDHVSIILGNDNTLSGDYLIGADGIHSAIRRQLFGPVRPRFTGNIAWRAVVPTEQLGTLAPAPNAAVWMGHKKHCVTYRLRGGSMTNFVGVVETPSETEEGWTIKGRLAELQSDFQNWHPVIENLITHISEDDLYKWALYDRDPLDKWGNDARVILLGDAAHPILPFMAQGAAMAIEDSWALAQSLSQEGFGKYQADRHPRTTALLEQSRRNMKTFHRAKGLGHLSYLPMWLGGKLAPGLTRNRFNGIYDYDVTQGD